MQSIFDGLQFTFDDVRIWDWQSRIAMSASLMLGLGVFLTVARLVLIVDRHVRTFAEEWEFEQSRRVRLRSGSKIYRLTEPLIDELCGSPLMRLFDGKKIELSLSRGADPLPWKPEEYPAVAMMESLVLFLGIVLFGSGASSLFQCILAGLLFSFAYLYSSVKSLHRRADERIDLIQRRMPFGIDLIALMMRAGAGFRDALQTVISESGHHPFSSEFQRVLDDVNRGKTLYVALGDLAARLRSDDIREMVFAIQKSEELGTPLAEIFANLADQMRLRKSQWAEAAAGKAQIKMHGPQLVIMVACMITILTPFVFEVFGGGSSQ